MLKVFVFTLLYAHIANVAMGNYVCPGNLPADIFLQKYRDKCYYFYLEQRRSYNDATLECKRSGGILASAKSKDINDFIDKALKSLYGGAGNSERVWIGLNNIEGSGEYTWEDGSEMDYHNFEEYEIPHKIAKQIAHAFGAFCVAMDPKTGMWVDEVCKTFFGTLNLNMGDNHPFVCEFQALEPTKAPTTTTSTTSTTPQISTRTSTLPQTTQTTTRVTTETTIKESTEAKRRNTTAKPFTTTEAEASQKGRTSGTPKHVTATRATTHSLTTNDQTTQTDRTSATPADVTKMEVTTGSFTTEDQTIENNTSSVSKRTFNITMTPTTQDTTTTTKPPCQELRCNLDCGLYAYKTEPDTGCVICICDFD